MILETIHSRDDLLALNAKQDAQLCEEIRQFLISHVSRTGGHLASNLGIVETTLAIHKVFDTSRDRLVFDVGHQCYVHKILTGRMEAFSSLRQFGGISGFPKPSESVHDAFIAGHASNSVSVALGMARARTLGKEEYDVIALLGDGALTGGLAYEGLNNAGASREPMIVILNDNGMSIAPNVGAISRYLSRARMKPGYIGLKLWYRNITKNTPAGRALYNLTHRIKARMKRSLIGTTLFENLGFTYFGPIDGHDTETIVSVLRIARSLREPVLLHLITRKGKGYAPAENMPQDYHGVGIFDPELGCQQQLKKTFSDVFGEELCRLAEQDSSICAITAAMRQGTGLEPFSQRFASRFFDVGISESHAVCMAAGLAKQGLTPVFAVYSTFLQRGYDMLLHDTALLGLHVVFAVDRAGLVGSDGETHHGIFDVSFLRDVPGMRIFAPASFAELRQMLNEAVCSCSGPVAVRYPRGGEGAYRGVCMDALLRSGQDCTIVCYGTLVNSVLEAEALLKKEGVQPEILKLPSLRPLAWDAIERSARKTGHIFILEELSENGSIANEIFSHLAENGIHAVCRSRDLGGGFVSHGSVQELYRQAGLDGESVFHWILEELKNEKQGKT